jgi:hypothetical protein
LSKIKNLEIREYPRTGRREKFQIVFVATGFCFIAAGIRGLTSFHPWISPGALVGKAADPLLRVNGRLVRRIGISAPKDVSMTYFAYLPRHNLVSLCDEME